jgi:phthalate 4,5-cis-dihydrodiol dehydrogenase
MEGATTTVRLGIAGLGALAAGTLPAITRHPNIQLTAAADVRRDVLDRFAADFDAATYLDVDELCRSSDVDAVFVATPTQFHVPNALSAFAQGKHVLVAKPLAVTLDEANTLIDAADKAGVQLVEAHPQSLEAPLREIRRIVREGELGRLRMLHNWQYGDWLYRPRLPEELNTSLGGGVTYRQGEHQVDIIRMIAGGMVRSVRAMTGVWDSGRPTEGAHTLFLDFEDGAVATAVFSGYGHFHSTELTYGLSEGGGTSREPYGSARRALREATGAQDGEASLKRLRGYQETSDDAESRRRGHSFYGLTLVSCDRGDIRQSPDGLFIYGDEAIEERPIARQPDGRDAVVSEFFDAIVGAAPALHDGRWARANLEVCVAALRSSRERREIMLERQVPAPT